jgi:hypothetical protein
MKQLRLLLLMGLLAAASAAQATGLGLRVGTTGLGADLGFGLTESLTFRVGYAGFSWSGDYDEDDITYDLDLKLSNLSALVDWKFWGQMRLTAGLVHAKNKGTLVGRPTGGTFTINDVDYTAAEIGTLNGDVRFGKSLTPYLGIGYGDISRRGLSFYMDLGLMFHGSPEANLRADCGTTPRCAQLQADVAEEERKLREDLDKLKVYPVFNLGLAYGW